MYVPINMFAGVEAVDRFNLHDLCSVKDKWGATEWDDDLWNARRIISIASLYACCKMRCWPCEGWCFCEQGPAFLVEFRNLELDIYPSSLFCHTLIQTNQVKVNIKDIFGWKEKSTSVLSLRCVSTIGEGYFFFTWFYEVIFISQLHVCVFIACIWIFEPWVFLALISSTTWKRSSPKPRVLDCGLHS